MKNFTVQVGDVILDFKVLVDELNSTKRYLLIKRYTGALEEAEYRLIDNTSVFGIIATYID